MLDLDSGTLEFSVNGTSHGVAIRDLPAGQTYRPAVCLYYQACRAGSARAAA